MRTLHLLKWVLVPRVYWYLLNFTLYWKWNTIHPKFRIILILTVYLGSTWFYGIILMIILYLLGPVELPYMSAKRTVLSKWLVAIPADKRPLTRVRSHVVFHIAIFLNVCPHPSWRHLYNLFILFVLGFKTTIWYSLKSGSRS